MQVKPVVLDVIRVVRELRCFGLSSHFNLENQLLNRLLFSSKRQICTTSVLDKRQSPLTIGTPAWKKAAIARKSLVTQLRKPKSLETIEAEMKLENRPVDLNIYTTTIIRRLPEDKAPITRLQPEIFMSKDDRTVICYHPAALYPREKTRESWERPKWYGSLYDIAEYSDSFTEEQESEAKSLIESDAKLWNVTALGHMLHVKPVIISEKFPQSQEQISELKLEQNMLREWGKVKRMDYRKYQNQERIEYVRKTRGEEAVKKFKRKMNI